MSDRLDELAMRRRRLLLRSERLRADLAADQRVLLEALSGVDRAISIARSAAKPLMLVGAGALLLRLLRKSRPVAGAGLAMKALFWVSMARKALPYATLARNMWRSRSSQRAEVAPEVAPEAEQPR
jgi:hypothetical protein